MSQSSHFRKNLAVVLLGATLTSGLVLNVSAAPKGKAGPKTTQDLIREEQALLISGCPLSDDQQKAVKESFQKKLDAVAAWEKANADKLKAAEDAAKAARQGSDASAKKTAASNVKALVDARNAATADADKAILGALNDEQRTTWAGLQLAQTTLPRYKKANLSDDQTAKIKSACAIAAKDLTEFSGDDKKSKQGRTTVQKSLKWAIDNVVLTPDQRSTMQPKSGGK